MKRTNRAHFLIFLSICLLMISSCGGHGKGSTTNLDFSNTGSVKVTIQWPEPLSRDIPAATKSLKFNVSAIQGDPDADEETVEWVEVLEQIFDRPLNDTRTEYLLDRIPKVKCKLELLAYSDFNGTGTLIASAQTYFTLSQLVNTVSVAIQLENAVDHVKISPEGGSVTVGGTKNFVAKGYDAEGNELPVHPASWGWDIVPDTVANISSSGNSVTVTGIQDGSAILSVQLSEASKSDLVNVFVGAGGDVTGRYQGTIDDLDSPTDPPEPGWARVSIENDVVIIYIEQTEHNDWRLFEGSIVNGIFTGKEHYLTNDNIREDSLITGPMDGITLDLEYQRVQGNPDFGWYRLQMTKISS